MPPFFAAALPALWKYRKLAGWGLLLAALLGTHAWAYYSGKDAEQNRVDRARLERIEADHLASLAVMEQFLTELRRIQGSCGPEGRQEGGRQAQAGSAAGCNQ